METATLGKHVKGLNSEANYNPDIASCLVRGAHEKRPNAFANGTSRRIDKSKVKKKQLTIDDHCTQRPILVGYAFGPKKMSTMSVVMAEASKAASTVVTNLPSQFCNFRFHDDKEHEKVDEDESDNCNGHDGREKGRTCHGHGTTHFPSSPSSSSSSSSFCSLTSLVPNATATGNGNLSSCPFCDKLSAAESTDHGNIFHHQQNLDDPPLSSFGSEKLRTVCIFPSSFFQSSSTATAITSSPISTLDIGTCVAKKRAKTSVEEASFVTATTTTTAATGSTGLEQSCSLCPFEYLVQQQDQEQKEEQFLSICRNSNDSFHNLPRHFQPIKVSFVPLDLDNCLEQQHGGKFDAILHKMTEDILCASQLEQKSSNIILQGDSANNESENQALQRIQRLNEYKQKYPSCCLIDHPVNVQKLMSRRDIASTLETCLKGVCTSDGMAVTTPRYTIVSDFHGDSQNVARDIDDSNLRYPLIVKPLTAAGTKQSHKMGVLLGRHGLTDVRGQGPFLLQEYANHDCVLYKVYVLGNKVWVFQRPSLPNLPLGEADPKHNGGTGFVEFDSQRPYPTLEDFGISMDDDETRRQQQGMLKDDEQLVTVSDIRPVADSIRKAFGLDLFGFDVLVKDTNDLFPTTKEMLVVDVNYFPSYKEVTNFSQVLAQYLAQCGIEGRLRSYNDNFS